jgi:bromodomain-containing protein 8
MSPLTNVECLLLAQAVYEYGANAWHQVSKLLSKHPIISRPKTFFSANSCRDIYARLINDAQLECTESDANAPHALVNLKLAQKFYSARLLELRDLIAAEEVKFKTIVAEIQDIRAGKWDDKIRAKLSGTESEHEAEHDAAPTQSETVVEPEVSHDIQEQERDPTPKAEEVEEEPVPVQEPENIELHQAPDPIPAETKSPCQQQTEEHEPENENDEQPIELDEPVVSTHEEETEQSEWEQQPTSPDDDASEIEAILTPGAPEGSVEEEASQHSPEHEEELPVHEEETLEREEEEASHAQDTEHVHTEPEQEISIEVDAEQNLSVETETSSQAKRKVDEVEVDDGEGTEEPNKKRLREESPPPTPGEEEQVTTRPRRDTTSSEQRPSTPLQSGPSGSTAQSTTQALPIANKRFQAVINLLHSQISQHRNGNIFHNPIKPTEAPDYHDIIKRPMDLKTIKARIKDGVIRTSRDFQRDVYLMFANAIMYNRPGSDIALMAEEMMLESENHINSFRQTEGYLRNTRA